MSKIVKFPKEVFSEKELRDLQRRVEVARLLRAGETWQKIKEKSGAHLQTIALIAKRIRITSSKHRRRDVVDSRQSFRYNFGQKQE